MKKFVDIQSEAAIRSLAGSYPYDDLEDEHADITLRSGGEEVKMTCWRCLSGVDIAGIEIIEARISYLAYARIASAMLQRQQATAHCGCTPQDRGRGRKYGGNGTTAIIGEKEIIELDEEKAAMVQQPDGCHLLLTGQPVRSSIQGVLYQ